MDTIIENCKLINKTGNFNVGIKNGKIAKISKIPFEKFPFKTSVGTTKPTATAPRIYMIPTAIVAPIIVRTNVLLPPLTSLMKVRLMEDLQQL